MHNNSELVAINPKDYQDNADKIDFLGIYGEPTSPVTLMRSTNASKVTELVKALRSPACWERPICLDSHLPYYAMTAYLEDKISRQKISQILEFHELQSSYPRMITLPILTKTGEFTQQAKRFFTNLTTISTGKFPKVTNDHIEQFRKSLWEQQKSSSASACVLHFVPENDSNHIAVNGLTTAIGTVARGERGTMIFPGPVRNIFFHAITPKDSTRALTLGKLGPFSIDHIEEKQRQAIRIHATAYPGAYRTIYTHYAETTQFDSTMHDAEHQAASCFFPEKLYDAVLLCVDVIRKKTEQKWSKETWTLIDGYFIGTEPSVIANDRNKAYTVDESLSEEQCRTWLNNFLMADTDALSYYIILDDMLLNKKKWGEYLNVDDFFKFQVSENTKLAMRPKEFTQIVSQENLRQQLSLGVIFEWPGFKDSVLASYFVIKKNAKNNICLFLFDEPISNFSQEQLVELLNQVNDNDFRAMQLLNTAIKGDVTTLNKLNLSELSNFKINYPLKALQIAISKGHDQYVSQLLASIDTLENTPNGELENLAQLAVKLGHEKIVQLFLKRQLDRLMKEVMQAFELMRGVPFKLGPAETAKMIMSGRESPFFGILLREAARCKKSNIAQLVFDTHWKLPIDDMCDAITTALNHNNQGLLAILLASAKNYYTFEEILNNLNVSSFTFKTGSDCLNQLLLEIPFNHPWVQKLSTRIVKTGNVDALNILIEVILKRSMINEERKNSLIMSYLLNSLSSEFNRLSYNHGCPHHPMVCFLIDKYITLSSRNHLLTAKNNSPVLVDLENLITKILSSDSELGLHYLLNHELIKNNRELFDYCLHFAQTTLFSNSQSDFKVSRLDHENKLPTKNEEFQASTTDIDKIELLQIDNENPKKPAQWYILYKMKGFDCKMEPVSEKAHDSQLKFHLEECFQYRPIDIPLNMADLKAKVALYINYPNKETYYLRLLLRMGLKLVYSSDQGRTMINGNIDLQKIMSTCTQCLLGLSLAIVQMQKPGSKEEDVQKHLHFAMQFKEFDRELLLLVNNKSIPVNVHVLKQLRGYFVADNQTSRDALELIDERITFLQDNPSVDVLPAGLFNQQQAVICRSDEGLVRGLESAV